MPVMNGQTLVIDSSKNGQRIDNYLITNLKGVPKSHIYKLLRTGKIRVNGKRVKQTYRLQIDDSVNIPELYLPQSSDNRLQISLRIQDQINASILYEDEMLQVLNKPAGIAVHPGTGVAFGVIEILRELRPAAPYLELVHRLDRDTSGCLLIAKTKTMLNELHELLRLNKIHKEYFAVLMGKWPHGDKIVTTPLVDKQKFTDYLQERDRIPKSKSAITKFSISELYNNASLMKVQIDTGRTHQIRRHAAQLGYPVVGDQKYGDFSFNRKCKKIGIKRMLLHASKISFQLPKSGQHYEFSAPIDDNMQRMLNILKTYEPLT